MHKLKSERTFKNEPKPGEVTRCSVHLHLYHEGGEPESRDTSVYSHMSTPINGYCWLEHW